MGMFMFSRVRSRVALCGVLCLVLIAGVGCGVQGSVYYKPPFLPVRISFDTQGRFHIDADTSIATELGDFGVSGDASSNSVQPPKDGFLLWIQHLVGDAPKRAAFGINENDITKIVSIDGGQVVFTFSGTILSINGIGHHSVLITSPDATDGGRSAYSESPPTATNTPFHQSTPLPVATHKPAPPSPPTDTPHPPPPPVTIKMLGGISDWNGYCQSIGDSSASLDGSTAYSWNCVASDGQHVGLSVTAVCQWQYHNSGALDRLADYNDPKNGWQCFTGQELGNISDWNGYCQSIGDSSAVLDGSTAYSWNCVTSSGQHQGLSVTAVCQWQYHDSNALDRLTDYNNPNSGWQCWG